MNLKQLDLDTLSTLWLVSDENPILRKELEVELQIRINTNRNFSREFIFKICKVLNHALGVSFIPSSEAYKNYGSHITFDMILDENEVLELAKNYSSNPPVNTSGTIKANVLVLDNLSLDQIEQLLEIGFSTNDILSTRYVR